MDFVRVRAGARTTKISYRALPALILKYASALALSWRPKKNRFDQLAGSTWLTHSLPRTSGRSSGGNLPHINSHALGARECRDRSRATPATISATAPGPALGEDETDDGRKKFERKHNGKGKEKRGRTRRRGASCPGRINLGAGVSMTVFIGGNRDARPHKARKPKRGAVEVEGMARERESRHVGSYQSLRRYGFACDGPAGGQRKYLGSHNEPPAD
jgi:hypothetical protein